MIASALNLAPGRTTHYRTNPFRRAFGYDVRMIDVDVDQLEAADKLSGFFSVDKWNLLSLDTSQRGNRGERGITSWPRETFTEAGIEVDNCRIRLVTFPKTIGYSFAPLSLWLLVSPTDELKGIIYEVNNTFGDDHSYVAEITPSNEQTEADKRFHVSPFFDVSGKYRFTIEYDGSNLSLLIDNIIEGERVHSAALDLDLTPATQSSLRNFAIRSVFSGLLVTLQIHWQAVKLWMRGARYHSRKTKTRNGRTLAQPITPRSRTTERST